MQHLDYMGHNYIGHDHVGQLHDEQWPDVRLHRRPWLQRTMVTSGHNRTGISFTTNNGQMFGSIGSSANAVASTFFSVTQSLSRVVCGRLLDVLRCQKPYRP